MRWISEPDKGIYDAFNKACRLVRGEWVLFMGAGDLLHDDMVLARFASAAAQVDCSTEIIYGKVQVTDPDYNNIELLNRPWSEMAGRWRGGRPMIRIIKASFTGDACCRETTHSTRHIGWPLIVRWFFGVWLGSRPLYGFCRGSCNRRRGEHQLPQLPEDSN